MLTNLSGGARIHDDLRLSWRLLPLVANAIAIFAVGADRRNWPEPGYWPPWFLIAGLAFSAALPVIQHGISEYWINTKHSQLVRNNKIHDALVGALVYLATYCDADWKTTAVQAFAVKPKWRWTLNPWRIREERQVRVGKVRLALVPSSGIEWTKGKGLIGRCWQMKAAQWKWLNLEFAPFANETKTAFLRNSSERVYGLSYEEFQAVKDKYGLVAVVPILDDSGKYLGCVTMDTPVLDPAPQIDRTQAMDILGRAAKVVRDQLTE